MYDTPDTAVRCIGKDYQRHDDRSDTDRARRAFRVMAQVNEHLFQQIPVEVTFQSDDPYDDYRDMARTVAEERRLRVFDGGEPHPIWDHRSEVVSRAVHDWFGHLQLGVDFSPRGEYRKWEHAQYHYPAVCRPYLFTEVVGQLGAVYYLDDGFASDHFEQKVFPAPGKWFGLMANTVGDNTQVLSSTGGKVGA